MVLEENNHFFKETNELFEYLWVNVVFHFSPKQVFNKLIRRYKYLEKGFEEEIKKVSAERWQLKNRFYSTSLVCFILDNDAFLCHLNTDQFEELKMCV